MSTVVTGGRPITFDLTIKATRPVVLVMEGYETYRPAIVYFHRSYGSQSQPFQGTKKFEFPMPILPDHISFRVTDQNGATRGIKIEKIEVRRLNVNMPDNEFSRFAKRMSKEIPYLKPGMYYSENGKFQIELFEGKIFAEEQNAFEKGPARVDHVSGLKQLSKSIMSKLTVPNRFSIIAHELGHYIMNTTNEYQADRFGAAMALDYGFSQYETMAPLSYLVTDKELNLSPQQMQEIGRREEAIYQFILNYKGS